MKYLYDCHAHSDFSDGDYTVEELFLRAKKAGLRGVVLTDHNTVNGLDRAAKIARKLHLETLEGVEISCKYKSIDIHIVGLALKFNRDVIKRGLSQIVKGNNRRVRLMMEKLNALKQFSPVRFDDLLRKKGPDGALMKYDIIKAIKKRNPKISNSNLIDLFQRGGKAYVPYGEWAPEPDFAVKLIRRAGGIPIFAHPGSVERSDHNKKTTERLVDELIFKLSKRGLAGLEVHYSKYFSPQEKHFLSLAKKFKLLASGGSDWHGEFHHPEIKWGSGGVTKNKFNLIIQKIKEQGAGG